MNMIKTVIELLILSMTPDADFLQRESPYILMNSFLPYRSGVYMAYYQVFWE